MDTISRKVQTGVHRQCAAAARPDRRPARRAFDSWRAARGGQHIIVRQWPLFRMAADLSLPVAGLAHTRNRSDHADIVWQYDATMSGARSGPFSATSWAGCAGFPTATR